MKQNEAIRKMLDKGVKLTSAIKILREAIPTLMFYDQTHITYELGLYFESPNLTVQSHYAKDFKFILTLKKEDVFTAEQIEANLKALREYPNLD